MTESQPLILCAGTQSGGSTLLSWCFLQRADTDGVLDARFDMIPPAPAVTAPYLWVKMTIACFQLADAVEFYRDEGRDVRPILLVRDVRAVFNSLISKSYGRNGTTADDPPLRLRLRRFLRDWQHAREQGWPVFRFEDFLSQPRPTLEACCAALCLPWDEAMFTWPKKDEQIADARHGNETFRESSSGATGLQSALRTPGPLKLTHIPQDDLRWLEAEFETFNRENHYPLQIEPVSSPPGRASPTYEATRRHWRKNHGLSAAWRRLKGAPPND